MVNLPQDYFRPLNQLIHGNYKEIKCDPITALVMASYLTLIVPAAFLMLNCLKGRINREASEKAKKVNEAALKAFEEEKARKLILDGDVFMLTWPSIDYGHQKVAFTFDENGRAHKFSTETLGDFERKE